MADFSSYLSDTDESAVDDLIAQAGDLVALDHLSSLNLASSHSSLLPSHLESRFQNLKSFPPRTMPTSSKSELGMTGDRGTGCDEKLGFCPDTELDDALDGKRDGGFGPKLEPGKMGKPRGGNEGSSGFDSSDSFVEDAIFSPQKVNPIADNGNHLAKSKRGAPSGRSGFDGGLGWGLDSSLSPPRKSGCCWCSPKKKSPRKNKDLDMGMDMGWGKHEELLSDLGSFSAKEQRRVLKEAMKEQDRLSKEAEKIVRIAKQASARMQVCGDSSDDETKL